jgi:hypothetical protein
LVKWPKTPASHAGNRGSNPLRVTSDIGAFPDIKVGVYDGEDPPVPIPNTVVKLAGAHDTWMETSRENRSMPTSVRIGKGVNPDIYSSIAQSVEHAAVNRRVVGSSPTWGANLAQHAVSQN